MPSPELDLKHYFISSLEEYLAFNFFNLKVESENFQTYIYCLRTNLFNGNISKPNILK